MNPLTQSKNTTILPVLIALTLGCFALSPQARAVEPAPDGGYPNQNTAEDDDARFSLTTGTDNTAMGFDALCNTTGSDNALASWVWRATGSLNTARAHHTATLLPNGMVLIAGGAAVTTLASAELYNPASGTWTLTGSLLTARQLPRAVLLPNGRVLVSGGLGGSANALASAELYGPASGTWVAANNLNSARVYHTETLLPNGSVLVAGGTDSGGPVESAEVGRRPQR